MRHKDLRGEKEWSGARELMCWRIVATEAGWKIVGSFSFVINRVLHGVEGWVSGGRLDRSMEMGEAERRLESGLGEEVVEGEGGGELLGCGVWRCSCDSACSWSGWES